MTAFQRRGRRVRTIKVPREDGTWVGRTTGTRDPVEAKRMQEMVGALGPLGRKTWAILALVTATPATQSLADLYRLWRATPRRASKKTGKELEPSIDERIEYLEEQLQEGDVESLIVDFGRYLHGPTSGRRKQPIAADTAAHYLAAVRLFCPEPGTGTADGAIAVASQLARFSERELAVWLEEMDDVEPGTVRKRGMGMRRFTQWLVRRGVLGLDPMRDIALPAAAHPLAHHLETWEAEMLADAQRGQYRLLAALLPASAVEVSVALALRVRDVMRDAREIRAAGTKSYNRDRIVRVAEWGWPAVLELVKGKHPDSLLFDRIPHRWAARDEHARAVAALAAHGHTILVRPKPYTMRDHRHTWAVRAARSGWPVEAIARQLGHRDGVLALRVYGRFVPERAERDRWETMATARDRARRKEVRGGR